MMNRLLMVLFVLGFLAGCASVNPLQKRKLAEWKEEGVAVEEKNETAAAALNFLPGMGDFYNGNVGHGIANLATWPLSILWAPVSGYEGAQEKNYFATQERIKQLELRREELYQELEASHVMGEISEREYKNEKLRISRMELREFDNIKRKVEHFTPGTLEARLPAGE